MNKFIGIFGGTFDPVHIGHIRSAIEVIDNYHFDKVFLLISARQLNIKTPKASFIHRVKMLELATIGINRLSVDTSELQYHSPYTIDILKYLRKKVDCNDKLFFILGEDAFYSLPTWYKWEHLLEYCNMLVLKRNLKKIKKVSQVIINVIIRNYISDIKMFKKKEIISGKILFAENNSLQISSTMIRQLLANKKSIKFFVPDNVFEYIQIHDLY